VSSFGELITEAIKNKKIEEENKWQIRKVGSNRWGAISPKGKNYNIDAATEEEARRRFIKIETESTHA